MYSTTTALSNHLKNSYRIIKKTDPITARSKNLILINQQLKDKPEDNISFEDALLNWIIYTCQPFTITESQWFLQMMKAAGCIERIPKGDTITNKLRLRVLGIEKEL